LKAAAHISGFFFLLLVRGILSAQNTPAEDTAKLKKIEFLNADYSEYDERLGINAMRIIGRVVLRHENVYMYADSAYRYMDRNAFDAFGRIHIEQGDSIDLYGDSLAYDGDKGLATLLGRVRMIDPQVNLETTYITYDIKNKTAFYPDSATTRSKDNNLLKSGKGTYYADKKEFVFTRNVTIENPEYTVESDTLHFKTDSEIALFYGPTLITSDQNIIRCEGGWYDTRKDICSFFKNASMDAGAQNLKADSIYYERTTGYGLAKKNVLLTDTVEKTVVMGNYAESFEKQDRFLVTDSVTLILTEGADSLFLSADTLYTFSDSLCDRILLAYHRVKFYRTDFQGTCDSLSYLRGDSLVQMFHAPVLWNDSNQLTANYIQFQLGGGKMKSMDLVGSSFIISREDSTKYNQISGVNMHGIFEENRLKIVDVYTDGVTVYYPKEEEENDYIGINRAESRDIRIYLEDRKIDRIVFISDPKGNLSPLEDVPAEETLLPGFRWLQNMRPKSLADIYSAVIRGKQKTIPAAFPPPRKKTKKRGTLTAR
jgi:lipopolysaccharide export system protein LptA